jgi:SAM-dependent methyltransferase
MLITGECTGGRLARAKAGIMAQVMPDNPALRERLSETFNSVADTYHRARPDYPDELFTELIESAGLRPGSDLLEIGCATGKATQALAGRGYRITCVEPGAELAAAARRNLAGHDDVRIVTGKFESFRPPAGQLFDLVYAATAWHWIDPSRRCRLAWRCLRPGGHLAIWSALHVVPGDGDPFFADIQEIYDEIGEGTPDGWVFPRPGELDDSAAELTASGLLRIVKVRQFDWEVVYDAAGYIELLDTFSGHMSMSQRQRDRLYGEIRRRLAIRTDGLLRRHWGAALTIARRQEPQAGA